MIPAVKICGISKLEDIKCLNEVKCNYVGFVMAKSKRQVTLKQACILKSVLLKDIKSVAVVVEPTSNEIQDIINAGFDIIQIHSNTVLNYNNISIPVWKAIHVNKSICQDDLEKHPNIKGYVFDNRQAGSGLCFDWKLLDNIDFQSKKMILAGGLNINNIQLAIKNVMPDIVDVSSGVETEGEKDHNKIKTFIRKVREL